MTVSAIWTAHCDQCKEWGYESDTERECSEAARKAGWVVIRSPKVALCRKCKEDMR
jgi:hypothetical protein